jgi:hypothetical protein
VRAIEASHDRSGVNWDRLLTTPDNELINPLRLDGVVGAGVERLFAASPLGFPARAD